MGISVENEIMEMQCPECLQTTTVVNEHNDIAWCPHCQMAYSVSTDADGGHILYLALPDHEGTIDPENKVLFSRGQDYEMMSVTTFSFAGIVLAPIALAWLFFSCFALGIHLGIAALFFIVAFFLVMCTIGQLHSRITLIYQPSVRKIIYTKGPFSWWRTKTSFKATEVDSIQEGAVGITETRRPCIFFNTKRHSKLLDFTTDTTKQNHLWLWLVVCLERGTKEASHQPPPGSPERS